MEHGRPSLSRVLGHHEADVILPATWLIYARLEKPLLDLQIKRAGSIGILWGSLLYSCTAGTPAVTSYRSMHRSSGTPAYLVPDTGT